MNYYCNNDTKYPDTKQCHGEEKKDAHPLPEHHKILVLHPSLEM